MPESPHFVPHLILPDTFTQVFPLGGIVVVSVIVVSNHIAVLLLRHLWSVRGGERGQGASISAAVM